MADFGLPPTHCAVEDVHFLIEQALLFRNQRKPGRYLRGMLVPVVIPAEVWRDTFSSRNYGTEVVASQMLGILRKLRDAPTEGDRRDIFTQLRNTWK